MLTLFVGSAGRVKFLIEYGMNITGQGGKRVGSGGSGMTDKSAET